jgi:hypothetical protein
MTDGASKEMSGKVIDKDGRWNSWMPLVPPWVWWVVRDQFSIKVQEGEALYHLAPRH